VGSAMNGAWIGAVGLAKIGYCEQWMGFPGLTRWWGSTGSEEGLHSGTRNASATVWSMEPAHEQQGPVLAPRSYVVYTVSHVLQILVVREHQRVRGIFPAAPPIETEAPQVQLLAHAQSDRL